MSSKQTLDEMLERLINLRSSANWPMFGADPENTRFINLTKVDECVEELIFFSLEDIEKKSHFIYCIDSHGKERWIRPYALEGELVSIDDLLIISALNNTIGLDFDGKEIWSIGISGGTLVYDNLLFISSKDTVYCYDIESNKRWKKKLEHEINIHTTEICVLEDSIFVASVDNQHDLLYYSLDFNGDTRWEKKIESRFIKHPHSCGTAISKPVIMDDIIYLGVSSGSILQISGKDGRARFLLSELANQDETLSFSPPSVYINTKTKTAFVKSYVGISGMVEDFAAINLVLTLEGVVKGRYIIETRHSLLDGKKKDYLKPFDYLGSYELLHYGGTATPAILRDETLLFGRYYLNNQTLRMAGEFIKPILYFGSSFAVTDNRIYYCDIKENLVCSDLDGEILWTFNPGKEKQRIRTITVTRYNQLRR